MNLIGKIRETINNMDKDIMRDGETEEEAEIRKARKKERETVCTEEELALMNSIFGEEITTTEPSTRKIPLKWKDYDIKWCGKCKTYIIACFYCYGTSCNGFGCNKCTKDIDDFKQWLKDEGYRGKNDV